MWYFYLARILCQQKTVEGATMNDCSSAIAVVSNESELLLICTQNWTFNVAVTRPRGAARRRSRGSGGTAC
jgi:hypothetical protein